MITYKLIRIEANRPEVSVELTDNEVETIYDAMNDYRDYEGDAEDTAIAIQDKISNLYSK